MESKRKNILTILLIIVIVVVVGVIGFLGFELINGKVKESASQTITDEFDKQIPTITEEEFNEGMQEQEQNTTQSPNQPSGEEGSSGQTGKYTGYRNYNQSYYTTGVNIDGYWVVGTIRIPASGIRYSIFSQPSKKALERGIGMIYTSNGINQPGNTVLAGHNYKNSLFFSKNKYLVEGNPIYIKDATGVEVKYIVTSKFTTNDTDTSFYQRDTGGKREITLSTCTDRGSRTGERLIVLAREE
ncbi:MAG: sortase [Clostridia bacterium]|jgi:LPXTG-site transpeptidase (sortase) family protein|nr:sortase [Clostridia bacterium]